MAELLIYNKINWMDEPERQERVEQLKKDDSKFQAKYEARYQKGDIIEVRPDGYWLKRGFNKNAFCVVCRENVAKNDMDYLSGSFLEEFIHPDVSRKTLRKRKYNIDIDSIIFGENQKEKITELELSQILTEKTIVNSKT